MNTKRIYVLYGNLNPSWSYLGDTFKAEFSNPMDLLYKLSESEIFSFDSAYLMLYTRLVCTPDNKTIDKEEFENELFDNIIEKLSYYTNNVILRVYDWEEDHYHGFDAYTLEQMKKKLWSDIKNVAEESK